MMVRRMGGAQRYPSPSRVVIDGYRCAPPILRPAATFHFNNPILRAMIGAAGLASQAPGSLAFEAMLMQIVTKARLALYPVVVMLAVALAALQPARAAGVTDTEIRIGNI